MELSRDDQYQYYEAVRYMVIDTHTGEIERGFNENAATGTIDELKHGIRWATTGRRVLVKLDCIVSGMLSGFDKAKRVKPEIQLIERAR